MQQKRTILMPNINFKSCGGQLGGQSCHTGNRATVQGRKWRARNSNQNICKFLFETKRSRKKNFNFKFIYCACINADRSAQMGSRESWGVALDCIMCALHGKFPFHFHSKSVCEKAAKSEKLSRLYYMHVRETQPTDTFKIRDIYER